jgi:hypothetical protein
MRENLATFFQKPVVEATEAGARKRAGRTWQAQSKLDFG